MKTGHSFGYRAPRLTIVGLCVLSLIAAVVGPGCRVEPTMPAPVEIRPDGDRTIMAFDLSHDRLTDFWQYQSADGRKRAIAYPAADRAPGEPIDVDAIPAAECPHFIIVLDGVPFELVDQLYREGRFRFFYRPSRVICCFPSLTDLGLAELFHAGRCVANQALYYDRETHRLSDGNSVYLSGRNAPWVKQMAYRCSFWWDGLSYLNPRAVFDHEMIGIVDAFRKVESGEASTYSIGSAGLGIRWGRQGFLDFLRVVDRLCEQIICERKGRVKITLTADHGHGLVEAKPISFDKVLAAGGYRPTNSLKRPKDVVAIRYGHCTYAEFYTTEPAGVATCVLNHDGVELVCYPDNDGVVVRDRTGEARITQGPTGFVYQARRGDPLRLSPVLERLRTDGKVAASGEVDGEAMFAATVDHVFPDPLRRIWEAFHALVDNPPDLLASLRDDACFGSGFFYAMIGKVGSTHGSLNRRNSTTFVMTTLGELPPALRSRDVLPSVRRLANR